MASALERVVAVRLRFGLFDLDPVAQELRKSGLRVRIQGQPFRILLYLAQRSGTIVSREELHRVFWNPDTVVDLDQSLTAAIHKIRECLDDTATNPRFLETLSRSGYRFIAPVTEILTEPPDSAAPALPEQQVGSPVSASASLPTADDVPAMPLSPPSKSGAPKFSGRVLVTSWSALGLAALLVWVISFRSTPPNSPSVQAITHDASVIRASTMLQGFPRAVTDNTRIYFARHEDGRGKLAVVMVNGGDTTTISLPEELGSPVADDVSPDGMRLLLRNNLSTAAEQALWVASTTGQSARQIPGVLAHDSVWMRDGATILYANGNNLYTVHDDGSGNTRFASLPGRPYYMRWSPDGSLLRLTVRDNRTLNTTLWEIRPDGSDAHQILRGWHSGVPVCCGVFLSKGGLFVYQAGDERAGSLWAVPVHQSWWKRSPQPFRLAEGPLSYTSPSAAQSGREVIFTGFDPSFRLMIWNAAKHRLEPAPAFLNNAMRIELSPDRKWIAWLRRDDGTLWRGRMDGTDRVCVTSAPYQVFSMAWSPDSTRLAIMARQPGSPWRILVADIQSSHTEELLPTDPHNEADPQWEASGISIIFGRLPPRLAEPSLPRALFRVDIATRRMSQLDGSNGLFSPRISPDGRTLVALNSDQTQIRQLDLMTGAWSTIATGHFDNPVFLQSGHALVYRDFSAPGVRLYRLDLATHQTSPYADGLDAEPDPEDPYFAGLMAGDMPAISLAREGADLYELVAPE